MESFPQQPVRCPRCGSPHGEARLENGCAFCLLQSALDPEAEVAPSIDAADDSQVWATKGKAPVRRLGNFALESEIARGGMGIVYRAKQAGLDRWVALKCLSPATLATPEMWLRFQVEVAAISRLDHPHIVPLYDHGEEQGQPYFIMKYVPGGTWAEALARRPRGGDWSKSDLRRWVEQLESVARAVHHAHQRGILHRDLKPSNILLENGTHPLVSDFGLAKLTTEPGGITRSSEWLGSPSYMAPEQFTASPDELTVRVDVYALGAILFEVLTGRPPHRGATAAETMQAALSAPVPSVTRWQPRADRDLVTICEQCCRPLPSERYASADALAADLGRWLKGQPVSARPVSPWARTLRRLRRNPALTAASALAVISLLAGLSTAARHRFLIHAGEVQQQQLLQRLILGEAEERFGQQRPQAGLAWLAHLVRQHPSDIALQSRLASALTIRRFSLPAFAPCPHPDTVRAVAADEARERFWTVDARGTLRAWSLLTGQRLSEQPTGLQRVTAGAVSVNQRWLALGGRARAGTSDVSLELWDLGARASGEAVPTLEPKRVSSFSINHLGEIGGLAVDSSGKWLVLCPTTAEISHSMAGWARM